MSWLQGREDIWGKTEPVKRNVRKFCSVICHVTVCPVPLEALEKLLLLDNAWGWTGPPQHGQVLGMSQSGPHIICLRVKSQTNSLLNKAWSIFLP